jgi:hypothetical protein
MFMDRRKLIKMQVIGKKSSIAFIRQIWYNNSSEDRELNNLHKFVEWARRARPERTGSSGPFHKNYQIVSYLIIIPE